MKGVLPIAIWIKALADYVKFKKHCNDKGIDVAMSYGEYPHGMFSAHKYPGYMASTVK